jgi:hypothetical protein
MAAGGVASARHQLCAFVRLQGARHLEQKGDVHEVAELEPQPYGVTACPCLSPLQVREVPHDGDKLGRFHRFRNVHLKAGAQ